MKQLSSLLKTLILATAFVAVPALAVQWTYPNLPSEGGTPTGNFLLFLNTSTETQTKDGGDICTIVGGITRCLQNVAPPVGTAGQTLRSDGAALVANSVIFNDGTNVGIGTATPGTYKLNVNGTSYLNGTSTVNGVSSVVTGVQLSNAGGRYVSYYGDPSVGYFTQMQTTATAGYGTYGPVTSDWALYNRFNGAATRGWIWQLGTTNVAGLSGQGNFQVAGTITAPSIKLTTGAGASKVLTSDASGNATWVTPAGSGLTGSGTSNYLTKWTGATALGNSTLFDNGTNVGIGTALPATKLDVYQASDAVDNAFALRSFSAPSTRYTSIWSGSGGSVIDAKGVSAGSGLLLRVNGTDKMMIQDGGNVGIGATAPESRLQLGDATVSTANQIIFGKTETASENYLPVIQQKSISTAGASNDLALGARSGTGGILFYTGGTSAGTGTTGGALGTSSNAARMAITSTGNVGIGTTAPANNLNVVGAMGASIGITSTGSISQYALTTNSPASSWSIVNASGVLNFTDNTAAATRMYINPAGNVIATGNVGIGNTSPVNKLDVGGDINIDLGKTYKINNMPVVRVDTTNYNGMFGMNAGNATMTGGFNTANGSYSLVSNTTGSYNTANGWGALWSNKGGTSNTANGAQTLYNNDSGYNNVAIGVSSLASNISGINNTATGVSSLLGNTIGNDNTAYGLVALNSNVAGSGATAVGSGAMQYANDTATAFTSDNTAVGFEALRGSTTASANTGTSNTTVGYQALSNNTQGNFNTASGARSLIANTIGYSNTAIGEGSLQRNIAGAGSTAVGYRAMYNANNNGTSFITYNTAVGYEALKGSADSTVNTGVGNTAVGWQSLVANTSGWQNVAVGLVALSNNTTGYMNTAVGQQASLWNTTGNSNTAIGYQALTTNTTGSGNTAVGNFANVASAALTNATAIGNGATATASNYVRIGNTSVTQIGGQVAWSNLSDIRQKENIADYNHGLDFIMKLRPVTFNMIADKTKVTHSGFIAQEVEATGVPFYGLNKPANDKDFYSLSYAEFVVPLVNSVKELKAENDQLRADNSALLSRIEAIEARLK